MKARLTASWLVREDAKDVKDCEVRPGETSVKQHRMMIADIRKNQGQEK